jgi:hypothetical protein
MAPIDSQRTEFADRNLVLQAAMGILSIGEHFDRLLARFAPERGESCSPFMTPEDRILVDFALGILSVRSTLLRVLPDPTSAAPVADPLASFGHGDLLR